MDFLCSLSLSLFPPFYVSLLLYAFCLIFPHMADRVIEEIGLKAMELSSVLMPVLLALLSDGESIVARQCIISGSNFFSRVLEELALQVSLSVSHANTFLLDLPFYFLIFFPCHN